MAVWCYIDGKRVDLPQSDYEAREYGWHKGAEYGYFSISDTERSMAIRQWCRETFDPHIFQVFAGNVYFLNESDAVACRLKWL